jgi:hypothetical protein
MNLLWIQMTVLLGVVGVSLSHANAQSVPVLGPDKGPTISSVLDEHLRAAEEVIVSTAMAMPEGKYSFVPTNGEFKGVRSFAEEVKHIATANNAFFGTILGGSSTIRWLAQMGQIPSRQRPKSCSICEIPMLWGIVRSRPSPPRMPPPHWPRPRTTYSSAPGWLWPIFRSGMLSIITGRWSSTSG